VIVDADCALRVIARTLHLIIGYFNRSFATDPPWLPVAPVTAMVLGIFGANIVTAEQFCCIGFVSSICVLQTLLRIS
jgi:hypothetical protein